MIRLNKEEYLDKLHACWLGKNIGGTIGAPYEGKRDFLDITGFASESGEPLPNDDLDLQLVWLCALEKIGARYFDSNSLADFWLDWIPPQWNEYGTCKANLRLGLLPPMSGEVDNDKWKTSNGAWIRSEIWASLAPGQPDIAAKYAAIDSMYDHGVSEGVFAEIFTATMQSLAYIVSDVRKIIDLALTKIPEDSMVAKSVKLVIECYESGVPYRETRDKVIEFNSALGWFQAPGNIAFVVIGLLYGGGDYLKSICYAVNCGDDTDCTGATVGATLGIIAGTNGIPTELREHIGDKIVTCSTSGLYHYWIPKTCTELTERVSRLVPEVMQANGANFDFTESKTVFDTDVLGIPCPIDISKRSRFSYDLYGCDIFSVRVELDYTPRVRCGDVRHVTLTFKERDMVEQNFMLSIRPILPEGDGWSCTAYDRNVPLYFTQIPQGIDGYARTTLKINIGERKNASERAYIEVTCPNIARAVMIPITFI